MDKPFIHSLRKNKHSLYGQAIDVLLNLIRNQQYKPGDKLPSEDELSSQLGISRTTLREATSFLERQGIVTRRHGVGTFIAIPAQHSLQGGLDELTSIRALAKKIGRTYERQLWEVSEVEATPELASALSLEVESHLVCVQMVVAMDGRVFAYLESYIVADLTNINKLRAYPDGSFLDFLLERKELDVSHTYSKIFAVVANEKISTIMSLPVGAPLLHLVETYQDQSGRPVVHAFNYFGTDVMNFYITRRVTQF